MIVLKNLSKTYATKNKSGVRALDGVNLTFPDKGLCLVLGKSGCGKTTLLNILGGLDVKYEGEFVFLNKTLTAKDFADYRKNYVSFVFQDFNLIDDLDVGENLSIGYNFAVQDDDNKQDDVLKKVGLEDYAFRFPQELSGGEQQRVAIARALLKDSKVLLADEPTGNLDKENSVDIYNLLKEISLKKLVIVVSHDEQLGREYADYIVRLDEGKVVENNLPKSECSQQYGAATKRKAIPAKIAWQMAWYEFTRKKSRSVTTVVALIVCLSLVAFALPLLFFNSADPHYAVVKANGYDNVLVNNLTYRTYTQLRDKGVNLTLSNAGSDSSTSSLVFQSKDEVLAYGIEFYPCENELPLQADTYYISDKYLEELILYGNNRAIINGEETLLNLTEYSLTDVVGGRLYGVDIRKKCAGVYRYPEQEYNASAVESYYNEHYGQYISTELSGSNSGSFSLEMVGANVRQFLSTGTTTYNALISEATYRTYYDECVLLDVNGNVTPLDENFANDLMHDNELYVNLAFFNGTFRHHYEWRDLVAHAGTKLVNGKPVAEYSCMLIPEELGSQVSLRVTNNKTNKVDKLDNLTIKGIVINLDGESAHKIWIGGQENFLKYRMMVTNFCAWTDLASIARVSGGSLRNGMRSLSSDYGCGFGTPASHNAYAFEEYSLEGIRSTMIYVAIAMSVVTLLSIGLLISGQILSRKREVGIFKALGAKNIDVSLIYVYESLIMACIVAVFSVILAVLETLLFNFVLYPDFAMTVFYAVYGLLSVSAVMLLFAVGTLIPLFVMNRINVIDSIRSKVGK